MAAAEVLFGLAICRTLSSRPSLSAKIAFAKARHTVHAVVHHAKVLALHERAQRFKVEDPLHELDIQGGSIDDHEVLPPPMRFRPGLDRSYVTSFSAMRYCLRVLVWSVILAVSDSGAGAPFPPLYLMPKSFSGPPGLWLAVRMNAPKGRAPSGDLRRRTTADTAGVLISPSTPTMTSLTPLASAMRTMTWMACFIQ